MPPERSTPLDASFLFLERPAVHMHVAALSIFDPSTRSDGRLRFEDVSATTAARIHLAPRFRQKVLMVPGNLGLPVWVDDPTFDLGFHVRRAELPKPGTRRELAGYVERVLSQQLDRRRPLWELHFIEGLEDDRVATLLKVHHAMIDGIAGIRLAQAMWDLQPEPPRVPPAPVWQPEPEPSAEALLRSALQDQLTHPMRALARAVEQVRTSPMLAPLGLGPVARGVRSILDLGARPPSPLDVRIGPERRFAMTEAPLRRFKDVKDALGGTVNDVVLTVVAGALHRWLKARKEPTRGRALRVMVPVSVRAGDDGSTGNRVAPAFVDVPVGAMSPEGRLARIRRGTRHLKESMMAMSVDAVIGLGAYAPAAFLAAAARAASRGPWFNLVVSNIPGPQQPMYLAGARLVASYPSMPLGENSALSIACTSFAGVMAFGLTADRGAVPDVDALAEAIGDSLVELCDAAKV
jgi:WS/DGAT/MGAT family acyltransferase